MAPTTLKVFVASHCHGCEQSRKIAEEMRQQFPEIDVKVQDLDDEDVDKPDSVFAVPTYVLNGEMLCLGNPKREWIADQITQAVNADHDIQDVR